MCTCAGDGWQAKLPRVKPTAALNPEAISAAEMASETAPVSSETVAGAEAVEGDGDGDGGADGADGADGAESDVILDEAAGGRKPVHACTHVHTHTCIHTRACTHTCMHTHACTHVHAGGGPKRRADGDDAAAAAPRTTTRKVPRHSAHGDSEAAQARCGDELDEFDGQWPPSPPSSVYECLAGCRSLGEWQRRLTDSSDPAVAWRALYVCDHMGLGAELAAAVNGLPRE